MRVIFYSLPKEARQYFYRDDYASGFPIWEKDCIAYMNTDADRTCFAVNEV